MLFGFPIYIRVYFKTGALVSFVRIGLHPRRNSLVMFFKSPFRVYTPDCKNIKYLSYSICLELLTDHHKLLSGVSDPRGRVSTRHPNLAYYKHVESEFLRKRVCRMNARYIVHKILPLWTGNHQVSSVLLILVYGCLWVQTSHTKIVGWGLPATVGSKTPFRRNHGLTLSRHGDRVRLPPLWMEVRLHYGSVM